ncbi:unnamed protein product, partial [Closterium sp. Naga37s-1]
MATFEAYERQFNDIVDALSDGRRIARKHRPRTLVSHLRSSALHGSLHPGFRSSPLIGFIASPVPLIASLVSLIASLVPLIASRVSLVASWPC